MKPGGNILEHAGCMLCGSSTTDRIFHGRDKLLHDDSERYPVVRCNDCGLVFVNPKPSAAAKAQKYGDDYPFTAGKPENVQPLFHYQPVIDFLNGMEPGRLLDVGTGNSPFLPAMKAQGWDVSGTEVDAGLVEHFMHEEGIALFHGELEDAGYDSGSFKAVTVMGVIEHVPDPLRLLQEAARILEDDGILAMWCFNRSLEARLLGRYWLGFDTPRHLYSFSFRTMLKLLSETGFRFEESLFRPVCYFSYSILWAISRVRNRMRPVEKREPTFRLDLPRSLEIVSRPVAKGLARRRWSSNMYLFASKTGI